MTLPNTSGHVAQKLRAVIQTALARIRAGGDQALTGVLSEVQAAFKEFHTEVGDLQFVPRFLRKNDVVDAEDYNLNLQAIDQDLERLYSEIDALARAQIGSFNYAQVVNREILSRADGLASTVLDLNILYDQERGDVLIAGDDFRTLDFVDTQAVTAADKAEPMSAGGMALARDGIADIIDEGTSLAVTPVLPIRSDQVVNREPTPGNFERFYEGNYYNFVGQARPEGGDFRISVDVQAAAITELDQGVGQEAEIEDTRFISIGATEEQKQTARLKMFDGDPSSFWECEYLFQLTPASDTDQEEQESDDQLITVDPLTLEQEAILYDFSGRDLVVEMTITLPIATNVNFVAIDPLLFGTQSFPIVEDIATAGDEEGQFVTVDGWDTLRFDRILTPEANEFLTDSQLGQTLAPSRGHYRGQGVFPFPLRVAKKIRIRLRMDTPVIQIYERLHIMLENEVTVTTTTTTTTKRGFLRF